MWHGAGPFLRWSCVNSLQRLYWILSTNLSTSNGTDTTRENNFSGYCFQSHDPRRVQLASNPPSMSSPRPEIERKVFPSQPFPWNFRKVILLQGLHNITPLSISNPLSLICHSCHRHIPKHQFWVCLPDPDPAWQLCITQLQGTGTRKDNWKSIERVLWCVHFLSDMNHSRLTESRFNCD